VKPRHYHAGAYKSRFGIRRLLQNPGKTGNKKSREFIKLPAFYLNNQE
jgi:hypothetical protein